MKKEVCACCGKPWKVQLETEKGSVRLCTADAEYALEARQQRNPKQQEAWQKFVNRVFR